MPDVPPPHVQRMIEEGDQLTERIGKLQAFFEGPIYAKLSPIDQDLMQTQLSAMTTYLNVLSIRLARANEAEELAHA